YQDEFDELLAAIARGERIRHLETVRRRRDGELIDGSVTISPIRDAAGRIIGASTIARDITRRKRAVRAAARLAAIVDSSDDAIIAGTLDGRIISWNEGARRLYGYRAEEAIGQHISMLSPPEPSAEMEPLLARVAAGQRVSHLEIRSRRKDGAIVDVSLTVSPIRGRKGEVVAASAIGRDIGERKRVA
ncbi:MAG: PAS domain-containing protein, partial [Solirubrobacteraceae bacterium]